MLKKLKQQEYKVIPETTTLGALAKYITTPNKDFQPMNANFGILPPLGKIVKDKSLRKSELAQRSLDCVREYKKEMNI